MDHLRSNKPIIALLAVVLVVLVGGGLLWMQRALQPPEARQNPTVVELSPATDVPASRATTIEFLFDQKMDHASVASALTLSPEAPYDLEWSSEGRGERLIVRPRQALAWSTSYRANIATSARNQAGRPLDAPVTVSFTTGSEVHVVEVLPEQGSGEVGTNQPITIRFDRPLVEVTSLEEQDKLPQPVLIDPPVSGIGRWLSNDMYGFYPSEGFSAGTEYEVTVSPVVAPGMELPEHYAWRFVTEGPRLEASFPFSGASEVERATAIKLLFNEPMDHESVEANFLLGPADEEQGVAGEFRWEDEQTLVFVPSEPLELATTYEIRVGEGARAQGGSHGLATPYRATFATVDFLGVDSVQPAPGSAEVSIVPTDTMIAIQFNHPVVSLVGEDAQAELPIPIRIAPELPGEGEWMTTSLFVYRPSQPLDPSTEYVVTLDADLQDTVGSYMNEPYAWSFATEFPRVIRVEPSNPRRYVPPAGPIGLRFNQPMDRASTEAAFSLSSPGDALVEGQRFEWKEQDQLLLFFPNEPLTREAEYTIVLGPGARGARGGETTERFQAEIIAAPLLRVLRTVPDQGSSSVDPFNGLEITFNNPINLATIQDNIKFVPTVTNVYTYWDAESLKLNLFASGGLEPSTSYEVTVGGEIEDESGQPLGEPYTFSFTTRPLPPQLFFARQDVGPVGTYNPYTSTLQIVRHRNLSRMDFSLYGMTEEEMLRFIQPQNYEIWQNYAGNPETLVASWSEEIDTTPNLSYFYKTLVPQEGEVDSGIYLLRVTAPERDDYSGLPLTDKQIMLFAPVNLTIKRASNLLLVWATDLQSGQPVADLPVKVLTQTGRTIGEGRTDEDGLFRYEDESVKRIGDDPYAPIFALSYDEAGTVNGIASSDWIQGIGPWEWDILTQYIPQQLYGTIYTDRPLYRPGQTVHFRGVLRQQDGSALILPTIEEMSVIIETPEGESVHRQPVTLSPFGTFNGEFTLDEEAITGPYRVYLEQKELGYCYQGNENCAWDYVGSLFQVAEYQRPEFEVRSGWDQDAVVQGEEAHATLSANYYFGGTLSDAPYLWRLFSSPYFFHVPELPGYWSWRDYDFEFRRQSFDSRTLLRQGEGTLDERGQATIALDTSLERGEEQAGSQVFLFEADVRDVNDATLTGSSSMVVHAGEFYIGLTSDAYLGNAGKPFELRIATADTSGLLEGNHELAVEFYEREWYSVREQSDNGGFFWTTAFSDTLVASRSALTDEEGFDSVAFTPEKGGSYTVLATGTDSQGNEIRSRFYFWVTDEGAFIPWGRENNDRINLVADKEEYQVGDVARILIPTPYEEMTALITEERLTVHRATVQTLTGTAEVLEIPITEEMIPNMTVGIVAVKGMSAESPSPEFRVGFINLPVATTEKQLTVEIIPATTTLEPGAETTFVVRVTDEAGAPVQAELSLSVVDKAVLALSDLQQTPLLAAFYSNRPLAVQTGSSFIVNVDRISQRLAPDAKGGAGGGGGGSGEFFPEGIRSEFNDTAYWRADIVTDANGEAEVTLTLPDNLTTWEINAQGITEGEPLVGEQEEELVATLPLLVRPTLPRFFVVGDQAELRVAVHNNSDQALESTVSFEAEGLTLRAGEPTQQLSIPAGGRAVVSYAVTVEDVESASVTIRAQGGELSDAVLRELPVYHLTAPEVVATGGLLREGEGASVESIRLPEGTDVTQGELTVELAPSLAGATESALDWMESYPYTSVEAAASRLLPNVATAQAMTELKLEDPELAEELQRSISQDIQVLIAGQNSDGGWGWWRNSGSESWLSAYVLLGLHEAQEAGYEVPQERLARTTRYLERWLTRTAELQDNATLDTRAFILYVLSESGNGDESRAVELFDRHTLLDTDGRAFLLMALDNAGEAQRPRVQTLASELTARALLSATGAHWEELAPDLQAFDSSKRSTALVLKALVRVQPEHMLLPQAVRWLIIAREIGHWETTQETAWAVLALTDFMRASGELQADFSYEVALNDKVVLSERATSENLADPVTLNVGIAELLLEEANELIITRVAPSEGQSGMGRLYYSAWLRYYLPVETLKARAQGISVARRYEAVDPATLESLGATVSSAQVGDVVRVRLTVNAPNDLFYFTLEDPIPAGFEVLDPALLTTTSAAEGPERTRLDANDSPFWYDSWTQSVIRDEKIALFSDTLPRGTYEYSYLLRATVPGEYNVLPTYAYEHYHPEVYGRSEGSRFTVTPTGAAQ